MVNDIVDDPKIARMPDALFRAFVFLLAVANENGERGRLPELGDTAWRMRLPEEVLLGHLESLAVIGSSRIDVTGRWWMTNFAKRQAALTPAERMSRMRQSRAQNAQKGPLRNVTNSPLRNVTANVTELEKRREESESPKNLESHKSLESPKRDIAPLTRRKPPIEYPSSKIFRDITHRWPAKVLQPELHAAIGDTPEDLDLWRQVVRAWIGLGWNPMNTDGMLDCFKRKEIPHLDRKGETGQPKPPPDHDYFIPPYMRPK
jgi:hypothetical protein